MPGGIFTMQEYLRKVGADTASALGLNRTTVAVKAPWVEVDIGCGWRAALLLAPYGGQVVVAEVRVFPVDDFPDRRAGSWRGHVLGLDGLASVAKRSRAVRRGLTARTLRRVPLGKHLRFLRALLGRMESDPNAQIMSGRVRDWGLAKPSRAIARVKRRDARSDRFLAELAQAYVARIEAGSRSPVADVARRRDVAISIVRDAINEARTRGLLTPGLRGIPGGMLTPKGEQLLRPRKRRRS